MEEKVEKINDSVSQEQQINELKAQIELLTKMMTTMNTQTNSEPVSRYGETIKLIHLCETNPGSTYIKVSNLEIRFKIFGEERNVTLQQAEEIVGKYRDWFDRGFLTVANGHEEFAKRYGLKTAKDYPLNSDFVQKIPEMSILELQDVYPLLPQNAKELIITKFKRGIINKDARFRDLGKITVLNSLSDGAFDQVLIDLDDERRREAEKNHKK